MANYDYGLPAPPNTYVVASPSGAPAGYGQVPNLNAHLAALIEIRDTALRAYLKALKAGKEYQAEGMMLKRYDLASLKQAYIDARDEVDNILRHGNASSMIVKRIIPYDL